MAGELPSDITDPERIDPTQSRPAVEPEKTPNDGEFSSYMKDNKQAANEAEPSNKPSPMELAKQQRVQQEMTQPTMKTVEGQMQSVSGSLGDIKNQLHNKQLKLKQSQKYLIRGKLKTANEHIRKAAEKMGVDTGPPVDLSKRKNPIAKFLSMVSDGQYQMNQAAKQIRDLNTSGKKMNAGELLLVQVKLQKAQQELDYTSVLLGKTLDMIKTIFNVQI